MSDRGLTVSLEYGWAPNLRASGHVVVRENGNDFDTNPFENVTFAQMIVRLSEASSAWPDAKVIIRRSDKPGTEVLTLDEQSVELLRTDPVMLIRLMTFDVPRVAGSKARPKEAPSFVVSGYSLLASAFGDEVLVRRRADRVECPGCGRWVAVSEDHVLKCGSRACGLAVQLQERGSRWWAVRVDLLLGAGFDRYFLPRDWNTSGPWATEEQLRALLEKWLHQKAGL